MTQYQPNYPETFYAYWSLMNKYKFNGDYLVLISSRRGASEAILLYLEKAYQLDPSLRKK